MLVVTASAHRQAAFEAAQFLMDYLKTSAPFWKSEETPDGARWVEARGRDDDAARRWVATGRVGAGVSPPGQALRPGAVSAEKSFIRVFVTSPTWNL